MPDYEPLPGSLNELFRRQQQEATPRTLVPGPNGGFVPHVPGPVAPQAEREPTMGEIGNSLLNVVHAGTQIPRGVAWNLGPALVGRSGQGAHSGAEAFQRLGMDYNSPVQRAIGHGAGVALDLLADPTNLVGMGMGGRATAPLTRQLEQFAVPAAAEARLGRMVAPVAESNAAGRVPVQARIDNWMQGVGHPPIEFAPGAGGPLANAGALPRPLAATIPGGGATGPVQRAGLGTRGYVDPSSFGYDANAMRSLQLNSPNFNPANPVFGLGTGQFTQDASHAARMGLDSYNPLTTSRFLPGAASSAETAVPSATVSRLDRLAASARSPLPRQLEAMSANPPPARPLSSRPLSSQLGEGLFPGAPELTAHDLGVAPDQLVSPRALTIPPNRQATAPLNPAAPPARTPSSPLPQFQDMFTGMSEADRARLAGGLRSPGLPANSAGDPIALGWAERLRQMERSGSQTQPLGGFRGATTPIDY